MSIVFVRDDDANATTDPSLLESAYAPLFEAGIPINFSVIPNVALDTRDPNGDRERFLSRDSKDCSTTIPLDPDTPICSWIRRNGSSAHVLMHGVTHSRRRRGTEFGSLSEHEARSEISSGLRLMTESLGRCPIGFVAPWDRLSRGALVAAGQAFDLISTGWVDFHNLPLHAWGWHVWERLTKANVVPLPRAFALRHGGCRIVQTTDADEVPHIVHMLQENAEVAVIVLHHWMFLERKEPHPAIRSLASALSHCKTMTAEDVVRHLDSLPWSYPFDTLRSRARRALLPILANGQAG